MSIAIEPRRRFFGEYYPIGIYPRRRTPFLGNGLGYGFGNGTGEWIKEHGATFLTILGVLLTATGYIWSLLKTDEAKKTIDKNIPKSATMSEQEFQTLVDEVYKSLPGRSRQEVESTLRTLLGERVIPAPNHVVEKEKEKEGMPTWGWLAIGGGALYLLMQQKKQVT